MLNNKPKESQLYYSISYYEHTITLSFKTTIRLFRKYFEIQKLNKIINVIKSNLKIEHK